MTRKILFLAVATAILAFGSSAWAIWFDSFEPVANCEGWSASGTIYYGSTYNSDIYYEVTLTQGATVIAAFNGMETKSPPPLSVPFSYGSPWGVELCGDYTATVKVWVISPFAGDDDSETYTTSFNCPCNGGGDCYGTPGYWKNHPEAWMGVSLTLGGMTYTQSECLGFFAIEPEKTDGTRNAKFVHHLMAAKLNVLAGSDPSINPTIEAADAWIMANSLFCNPSREAWGEVEALKNTLDAYNNLPDDCDPWVNLPALNSAPVFTSSPRTELKSSWGAIKAMYKE